MEINAKNLPDKLNDANTEIVGGKLRDKALEVNTNLRPRIVDMMPLSSTPSDKPLVQKKTFDDTRFNLTFDNPEKLYKARHAVLYDDRFRKNEYKRKNLCEIEDLKLTDVFNLDEKTLNFLFINSNTKIADCLTRAYVSEEGEETIRFAILYNKKNRQAAYKKNNLNDIKDKKLNEVLNLDDRTLKALYKNPDMTVAECMQQINTKEVDKQISNALMQYNGRKTDKVEINGRKYTQTTRHFEAVPTQEKAGVSLFGVFYKLVRGTTLSSVAIKNKQYDREMKDFNANNAVVRGSDGTHYCARSARSDTPGRIYELMMTNYLSAKGKGVGISKDGEGKTRFTFSITSGQDRNIFKYLLSKIGFGEDELTSVKNIEKSIQEIWGDKEFILMTDQESGEEIRVNRPLFKTQVFSAYSGDRAYTDSTRQDNMKASLQQKELLSAKIIDEVFTKSTISEEAKNILLELKEMENKDTGNPEKVQALLARIEKCEEKAQLMKYYLALEAVHINTTGYNLSGIPMDGEFDQGKIVLLDMQLNELLNIADSYQCKSGCDRTLQMVAMKMALVEYEKKNGTPFNPLTDIKGEYANLTSDDAKQMEFADYFQKFAVGLGASIVNSARGINQVKWEHQKIVRLFCDPMAGSTAAIPGLIIDFGDRWKGFLISIHLSYASARNWFSHRKIRQIKV